MPEKALVISRTMAIIAAALMGLSSLYARLATAQEFDERFSDWPIQLKIDGRLVVTDETTKPETFEPLLSRSDHGKTLLLLSPSTGRAAELAEAYQPLVGQVKVQDSLEELRQQLDEEDESTIVAWHTENDSFNLSQIDQEATAGLLRSFLQRGNTLILAGPAASWASKIMIAGDQVHPDVQLGANLLLDSVLQLEFAEATDRNRILSVLASHPKCVGIGLEKGTALLLSGRKMLVEGEGKATLLLTSNEWLPNRIESIRPRSGGRQKVTEFLADLTEWRRDAIERTLDRFPPLEPQQPKIAGGSLFVVGGGGLPDGLMDEFVKAAGGVDDARLVYIPCSESDRVPQRQSMVALWQRMGVQHATFIHTKDRLKADQDADFYAPLEKATGIWFGGGRQWNFADSYYGTTTHRLMKEVLHRGGVIGGSSAGASIQARYLARATPIENFRPMAPGYERGGLGFLSGVAIDQHFSQRGRHKDMTSLVDRYPQLLGIGIDETTAMIVRGSIAEVVGEGKVHFYDRRLPVIPGEPDYIALGAGEHFDLVKRERMSGIDAKKPESASESVAEPTPKSSMEPTTGSASEPTFDAERTRKP